MAFNFVADENFPGPAVETLRHAGMDVLWITESQPGASDEAVLRLCAATKRVLLTFDKDFGELVFRSGLPAESGVILFRVIPQAAEEFAELALRALQSQAAWAGYFSVVTRLSIRMRPLHRL